jgi:hypothetical protein
MIGGAMVDLETVAMCTPQWESVLHPYLDRRLSSEEKQVVETHLVTCRVCRNSLSAELKRYRNNSSGDDPHRKESPEGEQQ